MNVFAFNCFSMTSEDWPLFGSEWQSTSDSQAYFVSGVNPYSNYHEQFGEAVRLGLQAQGEEWFFKKRVRDQRGKIGKEIYRTILPPSPADFISQLTWEVSQAFASNVSSCAPSFEHDCSHWKLTHAFLVVVGVHMPTTKEMCWIYLFNRNRHFSVIFSRILYGTNELGETIIYIKMIHEMSFVEMNMWCIRSNLWLTYRAIVIWLFLVNVII